MGRQKPVKRRPKRSVSETAAQKFRNYRSKQASNLKRKTALSGQTFQSFSWYDEAALSIGIFSSDVSQTEDPRR